MKTEIHVSVVISTRNRAKSLAATIVSLSAQVVPPSLAFEVIVVDNNSSDETRAVVESFKRQGLLQLQYVFEPREGVSFGRNAGIAAAQAEIIAFTDDDNDVASDWIATLKAELDGRPDVAAVGGPILPRWPGSVPSWLNRRHWSPVAIVDYGGGPFETSAQHPVCFLTANLAVRRHVFTEIGDFSPAFPRCQDHEFQIRMWRHGLRALYAPTLVVHARIQPERLTRRYHRRWHHRHGSFAAAMRLQEIIGPTGALLDTPAPARTLFGAPVFIYRELLTEAKNWALSLVRGDRSLSFHHGNRVRFLAGYLRQRSREARARRAGKTPAGRRAPADHAANRDRLLPARRLAIVYTLMALLVGGSAYDIATGEEHWPLSPYPMFAVVDLRPQVESIRLFGVTRGDGREIPLLEEELIHPFDQCRLSTALARTYNNLSRRSLTRSLLQDVLERYEARRITGAHDGPALAAVRAYFMRWQLDPEARNVQTPQIRNLLEEVRLNPEQAAR
jgi:glycosyltransferase involved in cell wall biosynthesis